MSIQWGISSHIWDDREKRKDKESRWSWLYFSLLFWMNTEGEWGDTRSWERKSKIKSKKSNTLFSTWNFERGPLMGRSHLQMREMAAKWPLPEEKAWDLGAHQPQHSHSRTPTCRALKCGMAQLGRKWPESPCSGFCVSRNNPEAEGPWGQSQQACHRTAMGRESLQGGGPCEVPHCGGSLDPQASAASVSKDRPQSFTEILEPSTDFTQYFRAKTSKDTNKTSLT